MVHRQSGTADDVDEPQDDYAAQLERATRGLLSLNMAVLEETAKRVGMAPLRALQSLQRRGPSLVTEMGQDLDLAPSSASRLSDRLAETGLITRAVAPHNRRATVLELTATGQEVLDDLVNHRIGLFRAIADQMNRDDCEALLRGASSFTAAYHRLLAHHGSGTADDESDQGNLSNA